MKDLYALSSYQFELPPELIAQHPCTPRDHSRLMIVDRSSGEIREIVFHELLSFLKSGDQLIFNDTKVIPARLLGKREGGGEAEIFLLRKEGNDFWEVLSRPGKKLKIGSQVKFGDHFSCKITDILPDGNRKVQFFYEGDFDQQLAKYGQIPLPHYIKREPDSKLDNERYQTVYAAKSGAVAAPTAGLHFTREMLERLRESNVYQTTITLHVGLGTFRPVQNEDIRNHTMHREEIMISELAARQLNQRHSATSRQICVGTTSCRALESVATEEGIIKDGEYYSQLFIYPGYRFKYTKALLTNFHLPGSSLLMLVSAFGGYELIREAYVKAVKERYRFFSYGDAMLII